MESTVTENLEVQPFARKAGLFNMIKEALSLIKDELDTFLGRKEPRYRDKETAVLSDIVDQQGELVITRNDDAKRDNIIITLVNVEEETTGKAQLPYLKNPDNSMDMINPEIKLNLYVLFSAFSTMGEKERYQNCLWLISKVVGFFQQKPVFTRHNSPGLDAGIDRLIAELVTLNLEQQNHLWGALGAKLLPHVLYKIRMLAIREVEEAPTAPFVKEIRMDGL